MALTKADMAERLFEEFGLNKREAKDLVEMFFEEIRAALHAGKQVKLSGFGNFNLRDKKQRPGRNPKTGEEIPISARRVRSRARWSPAGRASSAWRRRCGSSSPRRVRR